MKRSTLLTATAGVAGLSLALAACGNGGGGASDNPRLSSYIQESNATGQAVSSWAAAFQDCTDDSTEVESFFNGALFDGASTRDALSSGRVEVGNFSPGYHLSDFPLTEGLLKIPLDTASVPSVMEAVQELYATNPDTQAEWHDQGLHLLAILPADDDPLGTQTAVNSLDDLGGQQIRGYGTFNTALETVDAVPVDLELTELPEALQRGVISGFFGLAIENVVGLSLHESVNNIADSGFGVSGSTVIAVNKDWWDGLSQEARECGSDAAANLTEEYMTVLDDVEAQACATIRDAGIELSSLPESEVERWHELVEGTEKEQWISAAEGSTDDPEAYYDTYTSSVEKFAQTYPDADYGISGCISRGE